MTKNRPMDELSPDPDLDDLPPELQEHEGPADHHRNRQRREPLGGARSTRSRWPLQRLTPAAGVKGDQRRTLGT
jgi:hypothetical protein